MNDCLPCPENLQRNGSKCNLPLCNKQVKNLEQHLENMHSMTYATYLEETRKPLPPTFSPTPSPLPNSPLTPPILPQTQLQHLSPLPLQHSTSFETPPPLPSAQPPQHQPFKRSVNCHTKSISKKKRQKQQTEEHERKRSERLRAIRKRDPAEMVRFLVHNTVSLYSVLSLLAFLRSDPNRSISDYYHSNIKQDVFGDVSLSFLEDVYENREYLSSYYRHLGCYPKVDGKRVDTCLACGEKHGGCICPKLSPEFYVFCRKRCSPNFKCPKCQRFCYMIFHDCYDYFSCKRCDDDFKAMMKRKL